MKAFNGSNFPTPEVADDGSVTVSVPVTIQKHLQPDFLGGVISGVKDAIDAGDFATVQKVYRGKDSGERSSLKVAYEFDQPVDGIYGQIVRLDRGQIVGAMVAIAKGDGNSNVMAALRDDDTGALDSNDYNAIAQVALFGKVRDTAAATA